MLDMAPESKGSSEGLEISGQLRSGVRRIEVS